MGGPAALSSFYVNPAQVALSPSGKQLVVTEKATSRIDVFDLDQNGGIARSISAASPSAAPFGFSFDGFGRLFVSATGGGVAGASSLSSFDISPRGGLFALSGAVGNGQSAACWAIVSPNNRFAFTTNAMSGTISTYVIRAKGRARSDREQYARRGLQPHRREPRPHGPHALRRDEQSQRGHGLSLDSKGRLSLKGQSPITPGSVGLVVID